MKIHPLSLQKQESGTKETASSTFDVKFRKIYCFQKINAEVIEIATVMPIFLFHFNKVFV